MTTVHLKKEYARNTLLLHEESTNKQVTNENDREREKKCNYHGFVFSIVSGKLGDFGYCILVSFFPKAAKEKGLNPSQVGILFAISQICSLIVSFVAPSLNKKFGAVRVLIIANIMLDIATCCMVFTGLISHNDKPMLFFKIVFVSRMAQGFNGGMVEVCVVGIAFSGPLIGGLMYERLGHEVPFLVAGSLIILCAFVLLIWPINSSVDNKNENMEEENQRESTISRLVCRPNTIIGIVTVSMLSLGFNFMEPTMEVFMEKAPFNLNHVEVGNLYIVIPVSFDFLWWNLLQSSIIML